jgi:organic hydroperoxide reductase OsmC/OhrA
LKGTGRSGGNHIGDLNMRKFALLLAVALAACFTMTGAEAAKKKAKAPKKPVDAAYEWNLKHLPPPPAAAPAAAAKPAKAAKKSKKKKAA